MQIYRMYSSLVPHAEQSGVKVGGKEGSWNGSSSSGSEICEDDIDVDCEEEKAEVCVTSRPSENEYGENAA